MIIFGFTQGFSVNGVLILMPDLYDNFKDKETAGFLLNIFYTIGSTSGSLIALAF